MSTIVRDFAASFCVIVLLTTRISQAGPPPCPGDLNNDSGVDAADLAILLGAWGPNPGHPADLTNDGTVNAADLAILLGNWGPCENCTTPEECDDGNLCNGQELCVSAQCQPGTPPDCSDGDPCTADSCDPQLGCVHTKGASCNDDCAEAVAIFDGDSVFNTLGASTDGPEHTGCGQTHRDIWFRYTATCAGELSASTCNQADYDTKLVVYDGCDCADLAFLDCNDDAPGCDFTSQLVAPVVLNACYMIRVGGVSEAGAGTGTLTVACAGCQQNADCNDGNACTNDVCDPVQGCVHMPNSVSCNDGLFCNGSDTCSGGTCSIHSGNPCAGGSDCANICNENADNCLDPPGTLCGSNADTDCDNPDTCNGSGTCLANKEPAGIPCGSSANTDCDNPDGCDGNGLCVSNNEPNDTACTSDTNACTSDVCSAGFCTHPNLPNGTACTSDGNLCTNDLCSSGVCTHPPVPAGTACGSSANTACTDPDTCDAGGVCQPNHEPVGTACGSSANTNCDNPDACDANGVCQLNHEANGLTCFDLNFCNGPDNCQNGVCTPVGMPPDCDDGDPCTQDSCDPAAGCQHEPICP